MTASVVSRRVRRRAPPGGGRFVDVVFPVSPLAPLARALRHHPARRQGRRPALSRLLRARRGAALRSLPLRKNVCAERSREEPSRD